MENSTKPIFVFGSNAAGRHGKGAALTAHREYGASYNVGYGPTGNAYAIPTKDFEMKVIPLHHLIFYVRDFLKYAADRPDQWFLLTKIGCGLAGYTPQQIAPLFKGVTPNVILPEDFPQYMV